MKTLIISAAVLAFAALPARADTPGFACDRNLSSIEFKICTTPALAAYDRDLNDIYASVKMRIRPRSDVAFLVADQKRWLATRDACWSKRCIGRAYAQRLDTLSNYAAIRDD